MRIAILYICTGRYSIFWPGFFASCEQLFLPDAEKHYFVFTDQKLPHSELPRVQRIEQKPLGWPDITLKRLHIFSSIEEKLSDYDYVFFFNANCLFLQPIGEEFLPESEEDLVVVQHPGFYNKSQTHFPYEKNHKSCAHTGRRKGKHYVCGGINGGSPKAFRAMMQYIRAAVDSDLTSSIVACWHDESHLNKYILHAPYKLLHPGYATPDGSNLPFPAIIRLIDKRSTGGHAFMRGTEEQPPKNLKERFVFRPSFPKAQQGKHIVLARLLGGLGNQMFIYAAAHAQAQRTGAQLHLETGALQSDAVRRYELHNFSIFNPQWRIPKGCCSLLPLWLRLKSHLSHTPKWNFLHSPPSYAPQPHAPGNYYMQGYWQSPHYFADYAEDIRKIFDRPVPFSEETAALQHYIKKAPTAFLHLRRGDYTSASAIKKHGILPYSYYAQAKVTLERKVGKIQYVIFSDEPDIARELFAPWKDTRIAQTKSAIDDIMLMRQCQYAIIANSSFSWWGAWLGEKSNHIVIAPRQWFAKGHPEPFAVDDLFPAHWTILQ